MKVNTVNVVEYFGETIQVLHAFSDDEEGNKEAEAVFSDIAKENGFSDKDIEVGMEDGYLDRSGDDYKLFIAHS